MSKVNKEHFWSGFSLLCDVILRAFYKQKIILFISFLTSAILPRNPFKSCSRALIKKYDFYHQRQHFLVLARNNLLVMQTVFTSLSTAVSASTHIKKLYFCIHIPSSCQQSCILHYIFTKQWVFFFQLAQYSAALILKWINVYEESSHFEH